MNTLQQKALKEKAMRELEKRYSNEQNSLHSLLKTYRKLEKKEELVDNRHIELICRKLEDVYSGKIKRLMINVPPRSLKTEIVSKIFPVWCLGKKNNIKFMAISYAAWLAEKNSWEARAIYQSSTYNRIFPRVSWVREDQNTKQHWETIEWWQYYAAGSDGTITGIGCDIMLIDDPIKPTDADSDLVRRKINNNFHDTLESRLNDKRNGAIVIIMQRLHDDDLCGHLLNLKDQWLWDDWEVLSIPAIAENDDEYRKAWESFFEARFPIDILRQLQSTNKQMFSCQYQQNPVNKESQEFHEEWFRYYDVSPEWWRIFTTVDPAFTKNRNSDYSCIITGKFIEDKMYILEYTVWRLDPWELIDKIIYHIRKRSPEKIGIEAYQAQTIIWFNLRNELEKQWLYCSVEDIKQTGDKESKIRKLIPLYRNWLIFHKKEMPELENQLTRFPKSLYDDIVDAEQMLYDLYTLQPNTKAAQRVKIEYDRFGKPTIVWSF